MRIHTLPVRINIKDSDDMTDLDLRGCVVTTSPVVIEDAGAGVVRFDVIVRDKSAVEELEGLCEASRP